MKTKEDRNKEIVECALTMFDSFQMIGNAYGLTRDSVRRILIKEGINNYAELRKNNLAKIRYQDNLKNGRINLLNLLRTQETFLELTEQKGENYALAWRVRDVYGWGEKYSLDQLEKLIELRKENNGFYRCVKLSGLAKSNEEIYRVTGYIQKLLDKALHDIDYEKPRKQFSNKKYFFTQESIDQLLKLEKTNKTYEEIAELLEVPKDAVNYQLSIRGITRRLDYTKIDPRINAGESLEDIAEDMGCSTSTLQKRRSKLNKRDDYIGGGGRGRRLNYSKIDPRIIAGEPLEDIAEDIGCSTSPLQKRRAKLNRESTS